MKYKKGQSGNLKGRPKGTKNNLTSDLKTIITNVFDKIGGEDALMKWAKSNKTTFYVKIYSKLIPRNIELGNTDGKPFELIVGQKVVNKEKK